MNRVFLYAGVVLAALLALVALSLLWLDYDNHRVWVSHCRSNGGTPAACERLWDEGPVGP